MKKHIITAFNVVCLMTIFTKTCYAYVDPATTSYIIQIVAGVVIAIGAAASIFWNKITRAFRKKKNSEEMPINKAEDGDKDDNKADVITAEDLLDDKH